MTSDVAWLIASAVRDDETFAGQWLIIDESGSRLAISPELNGCAGIIVSLEAIAARLHEALAVAA